MNDKKIFWTTTITILMLLFTIAGASAECTTGIKVFQKNATGLNSIGFSSISGGEDISNGSLSNLGGQSWYINSSCGEFEIINITLGYSGASTSTGNQQLVVYNTTQGYHAPNPNEKIGYANQTNLTSAVGVYDNVSFYFNESFTVQDNQAIMFILWTDENPPEMVLQGGANYSEGTAGFNQEEGDWVDLGEDIPITIYYQTQAPTSPSIIEFSTNNNTIPNGTSTMLLWVIANTTDLDLNGLNVTNIGQQNQQFAGWDNNEAVNTGQSAGIIINVTKPIFLKQAINAISVSLDYTPRISYWENGTLIKELPQTSSDVAEFNIYLDAGIYSIYAIHNATFTTRYETWGGGLPACNLTGFGNGIVQLVGGQAPTSVGYCWESSFNRPYHFDNLIYEEVEKNYSVSPEGNTTYTLTANNENGTVNENLTITVTIEPPKIISFNANPSTIQFGSSATLTWETVDATNQSINQGIGGVLSTGNFMVEPSVTTVYTLTANSENGTINASQTITVVSYNPQYELTDAAPAFVDIVVGVFAVLAGFAGLLGVGIVVSRVPIIKRFTGDIFKK